MKKVLAIILAALVIVYLAACSNQQKDTGTDQGNNSQADSSSRGTDSIIEVLRQTKTGDIIQFGKKDNGEALDWIVYEKTVNNMTVISVDFLDTMPFDSKGTKENYYSSSLGLWAMEDFYSDSFSELEKAIISKDENGPVVRLPIFNHIDDILSDGFVNDSSIELSRHECWLAEKSSIAELYIPDEHELLFCSNYGKGEVVDIWNTKLSDIPEDKDISNTANKYLKLSRSEFLKTKLGVRLEISLNLADSETTNK